MSQLLTPEQVAERFQVTPRLVKEMVFEGKWPCVRINKNQIRFTEEQIELIVATHIPAPSTAKSGFGRLSKK